QLTARRTAVGYIVVRGERRRRRFWRILHELRNIAPDKRSGYVHTRARVTEGSLVVPPNLLGEVTPTPVPGERRYVQQVGGWGPFLVRVDDLLAACAFRKVHRVATTAGVVSISPPAGWRARTRAWWALSTRYEHYADMRDQCLRSADAQDRSHFLRAIAGLGVHVEFSEDDGSIGDHAFQVRLPLVRDYFPVSQTHAPVFLGPLTYFTSDSGN